MQFMRYFKNFKSYIYRLSYIITLCKKDCLFMKSAYTDDFKLESYTQNGNKESVCSIRVVCTAVECWIRVPSLALHHFRVNTM